MSEIAELIRVSYVRKIVAAGELDDRLHALNLSQSEVAHAIGVTPSGVSRWVNGKQLPRKDVALRLGDLLLEEAAKPEPQPKTPPQPHPDVAYYIGAISDRNQTIESLKADRETLAHRVAVLTDRLQRIEEWVEATRRGREVGPDAPA